MALQPGETKSVSIQLDSRAFAFYHPEHKQWITEDGDFDLLIAASAADIRHTTTVTLESTSDLPCILDKESTIREWMADPRGKVVFGPYYEKMVIEASQMFANDNDRYSDEGAIGMNVADMFSDMPLVSVLMFQSQSMETHPEDMVAGLLQQVHGMD